MIIDEVKFGSIQICDQKYKQALIIGEKVENRDDEKLERVFNTTHKIGDWEKQALLSDSPDYIIIGNGYSSILETPPIFIQECQKRQIEIIILSTPQAVEKYNQLQKENKKVNALIHTTC